MRFFLRTWEHHSTVMCVCLVISSADVQQMYIFGDGGTGHWLVETMFHGTRRSWVWTACMCVSVCKCLRETLSPSPCVRWGYLVKGPSALVSAHQSYCHRRHCSGRLNSLWQGPLECRMPPNINNTGSALAYDSLCVRERKRENLQISDSRCL